ncbi:MAG: LysR family transcriptional regulator [Rhodocyclaceae bacterium]|nr:LysR family transcriptional regulator [Rhodocyclaceae bacterium]MBP7080489.1 LysR family transcriptional regulator [Rhodocyclaceae bacterium]
MQISFRQLQVFLALVEHKSITAAARACHVTQPTVSMQLRELTAVVGLPLYEVIGKNLFLTAAGMELAESARAMVDEWSAFGARIDQMKGVASGRLRVAVVSTAKYFIPRALGSFCKRFPAIDIALEVENRDGIVRRLRENMDDMVIMSMPPEDMDIDCEAFMPNPLVLIAPLEHRLAGRRSVPLEKLLDDRFILREKGSGTRLACQIHFTEQQFRPQIRMELGSNEAIKQAVAAGMGVGVVSRHAIGTRPEDEGLAVLRVKGFPIHSNWFIVTLRGKRLSPSAVAFLDQLRGSQE